MDSWGSQSQEAYYRPGWIIYLLSGQHGYYVGITQDIYNRLAAHRRGDTPSSAALGDPERIVLIASRQIGDFVTASKVERYVHQTKKYELITDSKVPIPDEVLKSEDSVAESRVRWVINQL